MGIQVEPNGDLVYPCDFKGKVLGNLTNTPLSSLLASSKARELRTLCRSGKPCGQYLNMLTSAMASLRGLIDYGIPMAKWKFTGKA